MSIRDTPFPMQHGPAIPWDVAEAIYKMYSALYGTQQSLERLAERGGFGWSEVEYIQAEYEHQVLRRGGGARGRIVQTAIVDQPLRPEFPAQSGARPGGEN